MTPLAGSVALAGALLLALCATWIRAGLRERRLRARIATLRPDVTRHGAARPALGTLERLVRGVGESVSRSSLLSADTLRAFEQTVAQAGLKGGNAVALFIGAKVLLLLGLPVLAFAAAGTQGLGANHALLVAAAAAVLGLLGPDWAVRQIRRRHASAVERGLPDALDLMVICAEAGLGLEAGIERVAVEMNHSSPAVAREFASVSAELRVLSDRRLALLNLAERTGLESARRFGTTLAQTLQYGTPLAQALRVLAAELRQQRLTQCEERAARLPVLLTMPMIVFILPCVFLVVGGPAVLRAMDAMAR
jgi:tight adherence protein C